MYAEPMSEDIIHTYNNVKDSSERRITAQSEAEGWRKSCNAWFMLSLRRERLANAVCRMPTHTATESFDLECMMFFVEIKCRASVACTRISNDFVVPLRNNALNDRVSSLIQSAFRNKMHIRQGREG